MRFWPSHTDLLISYAHDTSCLGHPCTENRILLLFVKSVQLKNVVHFKGADV